MAKSKILGTGDIQDLVKLWRLKQVLALYSFFRQVYFNPRRLLRQPYVAVLKCLSGSLGWKLLKHLAARIANTRRWRLFASEPSLLFDNIRSTYWLCYANSSFKCFQTVAIPVLTPPCLQPFCDIQLQRLLKCLHDLPHMFYRFSNDMSSYQTSSDHMQRSLEIQPVLNVTMWNSWNVPQSKCFECPALVLSGNLTFTQCHMQTRHIWAPEFWQNARWKEMWYCAQKLVWLHSHSGLNRCYLECQWNYFKSNWIKFEFFLVQLLFWHGQLADCCTPN